MAVNKIQDLASGTVNTNTTFSNTVRVENSGGGVPILKPANTSETVIGKTLVAGENITITSDANTVKFDATGGGGGLADIPISGYQDAETFTFVITQDTGSNIITRSVGYTETVQPFVLDPATDTLGFKAGVYQQSGGVGQFWPLVIDTDQTDIVVTSNNYGSNNIFINKEKGGWQTTYRCLAATPEDGEGYRRMDFVGAGDFCYKMEPVGTIGTKGFLQSIWDGYISLWQGGTIKSLYHFKGFLNSSQQFVGVTYEEMYDTANYTPTTDILKFELVDGIYVPKVKLDGVFDRAGLIANVMPII